MSNIVHSSGVSGTLQINNMDDLSRLSKMMADSGFFADIRQASQCGVKILAGMEMGFPAFLSMTGIHIIKGKPSVGANLMAAKIRASGKYDFLELVKDVKLCRIVFYEIEFKPFVKEQKLKLARKEINHQEFEESVIAISLGVSEFSIEDAKKAGTQNLDKFPRNMLFARAISNGVKWYCPDVFMTSVYVPEELGVIVDDDNNVMDVSVVEEVENASVQTIQEKPQSPFTDRIKSLIGLTGLPVASIRKGCEKMSIPTSSHDYTSPEMVDDFMVAIYSQWGLEQGAFNVFKHSYNSLQKLISEDADRSDVELFAAWQVKVFEKLNVEADQAAEDIQPVPVEVA